MSREQWPKWLPYTPVAAVILVVLIALAFRLVQRAPKHAKLWDQAQPDVTPSTQSRAPFAGVAAAGSPRKQWRWRLPYMTAAAIIFVLLIALAFHLAHVSRTNTTLQNVAQPEVLGAPAASTADPTTIPGATTQTGDQTRVSDLYRIGVALAYYRRDKGEFPSTDGTLQSACGQPGPDALCKIKDYLDPIPADPTGDPIANGYWYVSDGKAFTLIAGVDSPAHATPAMCERRFYDQTKRTNLYCVTGVS